jgi:hypothetical protein
MCSDEKLAAAAKNGDGDALAELYRRYVVAITTYMRRRSPAPEIAFALGELFGQILELCAEAGLVSLGVIAADGTKVHANASHHATRNYEQIAREILAEADTIDRDEEEQFGDRRGDELPPEFAGRRRRAWLREAKHRLDARQAAEACPIARERPQRLRDATRRLEDEHAAELDAMAAYDAHCTRTVTKTGRRAGRPAAPYMAPALPAGKINLTDLDSRNVKASRGWVQGYNAQAGCTREQIVIAAELTLESPDFGHLEPMLDAALAELQGAGIEEQPDVVLADAGYWHNEQLDNITGRGMHVLMPPKPTSAAARGLAGTAGATPSCDTSSRPTMAPRSTPSARR